MSGCENEIGRKMTCIRISSNEFFLMWQFSTVRKLSQKLHLRPRVHIITFCTLALTICSTDTHNNDIVNYTRRMVCLQIAVTIASLCLNHITMRPWVHESLIVWSSRLQRSLTSWRFSYIIETMRVVWFKINLDDDFQREEISLNWVFHGARNNETTNRWSAVVI